MIDTDKKKILIKEIEDLPLSKMDEFIDIIHNFKKGIKKERRVKRQIEDVFGICKNDLEWDNILEIIYDEREKNYGREYKI